MTSVVIDIVPAATPTTVSQNSILLCGSSSTPDTRSGASLSMFVAVEEPRVTRLVCRWGTFLWYPNLAKNFAQVCPFALPHPNKTPVVRLGHGCPFRVITPQCVGSLTAISQQVAATVKDPLQNATEISPFCAAKAQSAAEVKINRTLLIALSFLVGRLAMSPTRSCLCPEDTTMQAFRDRLQAPNGWCYGTC